MPPVHVFDRVLIGQPLFEEEWSGGCSSLRRHGNCGEKYGRGQHQAGSEEESFA
jgi:hypothetical protein